MFGAARRASRGPAHQVLTEGVTAAFTAAAILLALTMKNRPAPTAAEEPTR